MEDKVDSMKQKQISSPNDPLEESTGVLQHQQTQAPQHQQSGLVSPLSTVVYVNTATGCGTFDPEASKPKRPRYASGQWKLLPSNTLQRQRILPLEQEQQQSTTAMVLVEDGSSPTNQQVHAHTADSSSAAASSPSHSPRPSFSVASGGDGQKAESDQFLQIRRGKYVSPVWKPNEMLWLARAWRLQYCGGASGNDSVDQSLEIDSPTSSGFTIPFSRTKTRAEKDREVAEFLLKHGVKRDAKTAGTKWDNMLGEFRKVYEWERGEREQVGKSYFRLSPYERKLHRLPASFDEQVFDELSQFMGLRGRSQHGRLAASGIPANTNVDGTTNTSPERFNAPPPPSSQNDSSGTFKRQGNVGGNEGLLQRGGFEFMTNNEETAPSSSCGELKRIGKIRMTWEESVSLWAEEGEYKRGRIKLEGLNFMNADELTFLDHTMVATTMEAFDDGALRGFSVDRFVCGQQIKVFGRRKPSSSSFAGPSSKSTCTLSKESFNRSIFPTEYRDRSDFYLDCLKSPPSNLPSLFDLSWHLQEPPPEDLRLPLRKDVYKDLPQGKELFFVMSTEAVDCQSFTFEIVCPLLRQHIMTNTASRDSFIGIWDDCINRTISKFCSHEVSFVRKPTFQSDAVLEQWPNLTGFIRSFCLWRGEEVDCMREGTIDPSTSLVEKFQWTFGDLPFVLGYYAIGYSITFCTLSKSNDRVIRTDLYTIHLTTPSERLKALIPCWRIAGLLSLLSDRCNVDKVYSDYDRVDLGVGEVIEMTPSTTKKTYINRRRWAAAKVVYDALDHRVPYAEYIYQAIERECSLLFKPRGRRWKPVNCDQLVEALKYVTKALVALHDLSFMHRNLGWDKVLKRVDREEDEWFVTGFEEAATAPQIYPYTGVAERNCCAPEMRRGLHGVKVDVWGIGQLIKTCGFVVSKLLKDLQNRCLDQNPEQRPTAADCYHHLLQLQSTLSPSSSTY